MPNTKQKSLMLIFLLLSGSLALGAEDTQWLIARCHFKKCETLGTRPIDNCENYLFLRNVDVYKSSAINDHQNRFKGNVSFYEENLSSEEALGNVSLEPAQVLDSASSIKIKILSPNSGIGDFVIPKDSEELSVLDLLTQNTPTTRFYYSCQTR